MTGLTRTLLRASAAALLLVLPGAAGATEPPSLSAVGAAGFQPIRTSATPGEIRAAQLEAKQQYEEAVRRCKERRSHGEKVGTGLGLLAGVAAGLLLAEDGDTEEKVAAGVAGALVGATAGSVAGRVADPRTSCGFTPPAETVQGPELPDPTVTLLPVDLIGGGPEPVPFHRAVLRP